MGTELFLTKEKAMHHTTWWCCLTYETLLAKRWDGAQHGWLEFLVLLSIFPCHRAHGWKLQETAGSVAGWKRRERSPIGSCKKHKVTEVTVPLAWHAARVNFPKLVWTSLLRLVLRKSLFGLLGSLYYNRPANAPTKRPTASASEPKPRRFS